MELPATIIFILTYIGIGFGHFPGLALDRTGFALLGGIAMVASGVMTSNMAINSIDFSTVLLLFGLMVVSAQLRLSGFYSWIALKITPLQNDPSRFLYVIMAVTGMLSAILANDIVCFAFAPVLCVSILKGGRNPIPFLLGLAAASNIGSAMTIIGNPQNMLIGQVGKLNFASYFIYSFIPSAFSMWAAYAIINKRYKKKFDSPPMAIFPERQHWPEFNLHQTRKGILGALILTTLFFTSIPRELSALVIGGLFLCSRKMRTRSILGLVDWHLITLFCGLFIVIRGIETTSLPHYVLNQLASFGVRLPNLYVLTIVSTIMSNLVSNVPATMLIVKFLDPSNVYQWYILALSSTFAGNLILVGSIANLITIEQSSEYGVYISFMEHAKIGVPVTVASIAITFIWIYFTTSLF